MTQSKLGAALTMCSLLFVANNVAHAADVTVLSVGALRSSLTAVIPEFEKATGDKVKMEAGAAGAMVTRVQKGEAVDVLIVTNSQIEKLVSQGKVISGAQVKVAKIGMGLAAIKGTSERDIRSMDAFKSTLVAAKSIGHTDPASGASSAIYAAKLLADLDVAAQLKPKIKIFASNDQLFEALASGDVELGFGQITEILATSKIALVGPLPAPVQNYSLFAADVVTNANESDAAKAFVKFLTSPAAVAVMKARGAELP
jgi:molybdate transport system substrate-binding protein